MKVGDLVTHRPTNAVGIVLYYVKTEVFKGLVEFLFAGRF